MRDDARDGGGSSRGESVPISSLLRIAGGGEGQGGNEGGESGESGGDELLVFSDSVELGKARARATAVRVIGVVVSLATVTTALALCARYCCGSSHRSRSGSDSSGVAGLGSRFSRWRSSSSTVAAGEKPERGDLVFLRRTPRASSRLRRR